ncbi:MAG TPA: hypothetical protein VF600_03665 [Abditibacteriaceae bacterium]|jgi:hypothetical protein
MDIRIKERHIIGRMMAVPIDKLLQLTPIGINSRFRNLLIGQAQERRYQMERRRAVPPALPDRENPGDRRKKSDRRTSL